MAAYDTAGSNYDGPVRGQWQGEGIATTQTPYIAATDRMLQGLERLNKQAFEMRERLTPVLAFAQPSKNTPAPEAPTPGDSPIEQTINGHTQRLEEISKILAEISARLRL